VRVRRPERVSTRVALSHHLIEVREHVLSTQQRIVTLALRDWVVIAATDGRGNFILVEQHRHGLDATTLECAGGVIDAGEEPIAAARRELLEETGYEAGQIEPLGWVHPNPALHDNRAFFFLAQGAIRKASPLNTVEEETRVRLFSRSEVEKQLSESGITHSMSVLVLERVLRLLE
jgi:8-oxo-dGTP pyrophosphatase MutT (NUDIX family)